MKVQLVLLGPSGKHGFLRDETVAAFGGELVGVVVTALRGFGTFLEVVVSGGVLQMGSVCGIRDGEKVLIMRKCLCILRWLLRSLLDSSIVMEFLVSD